MILKILTLTSFISLIIAIDVCDKNVKLTFRGKDLDMTRLCSNNSVVDKIQKLSAELDCIFWPACDSCCPYVSCSSCCPGCPYCPPCNSCCPPPPTTTTLAPTTSTTTTTMAPTTTHLPPTTTMSTTTTTMVPTTTLAPTTTASPIPTPCPGCPPIDSSVLDIIMVINIQKLYMDYCDKPVSENPISPTLLNGDYVHFVSNFDNVINGSGHHTIYLKTKVTSKIRLYGISENKNMISSVIVYKMGPSTPEVLPTYYIKTIRNSVEETKNIFPVEYNEKPYWYFFTSLNNIGTFNYPIDFVIYVKRNDVDELFGYFRIKNLNINIV